MNNSDKEAFFGALGAAFELYGKTLSPAAANLYFETLSKYEIEDVLRALSAHVQSPENGQFTPKPADIIRIIDGEPETAGLKAWSKVVDAIRMIGPYQDVVFDDPLIHAVITDMGGWVRFNSITEKELPFKSNEFVKRYKGAVASIDMLDYPKILIGISNAYNGINGHSESKPVLIGCTEKARNVYRLGSDGAGNKITRLCGTIIKQIT